MIGRFDLTDWEWSIIARLLPASGFAAAEAALAPRPARSPQAVPHRH
jgi:hypothetical protein